MANAPNPGAAGADKAHAAPLNPRSRLVFAITLSIVIACLGNIQAALAAVGLALLVLLAARPPFAAFFRRLALANAFILFIWLVVPFTTPGTPLFHWGFFTATREGVNLCLLATLKANALAIIFLALIAPMSVSSLGNALRRLHCPDKLTWLLLLMGRNAHILAREWNSLRQAAKLRCFHPRNDRNTYRALASMLAILLARAHDRAQRMHEAMLLRGFNGELPAGAPLRYSRNDALAAIILLAFMVFLVFMEGGIAG